MTPETLDDLSANALNEAIKSLLRTDHGRRVFFWLLSLSNMHADPFGGAGGNDVTNYTVGRQSVARAVVAHMDAIDPRLYPTLLFDMATVREQDRAIYDQAKKQEGLDYDEDDDD